MMVRTTLPRRVENMQTWLHWVGLHLAKSQVLETTTWFAQLGFQYWAESNLCIGKAPHVSMYHWRSALKPSKSSWKTLPNSVAPDPGPLKSKVSKAALSLTCSVLSIHVPSPAAVYQLCCRGGTEPSPRPRLVVLDTLHKVGEKLFQAIDTSC